MNQDANVNFYVNNPDLLMALCQSVIEKLGAMNDFPKDEISKIQLHEIAKAIDKLEKKGVDVPDSLRAEKTRLAVLSNNKSQETQSLLDVLNRLEEIIRQAELKYINGILPYRNKLRTITNINYRKDNVFYKKITDYVISFEGVKIKESKSMITYFCYSKQRGKNIGLVWLCYPRKSDRVQVYLRKETDDIKYPKHIIEELTKYEKFGWGKYPVFVVKTEDDCNRTIELIKYAHEYL